MPDVTFTVDGKKLTAPAGTLLIDACRKAGIEIPAFCYYPGLSLQAACRMCVVRQEKVPKLQTACTTTVAEGQVFTTESPEIAQARKATIELLLGNHPLDCPVCDAGGECELQDMTFKYGAGESQFVEVKHHRDEQQWSPAVFYDRPRCILCYRCIRMCGEGMDVWALGIHNRGADSVIVPNDSHQLDCEQCGMCIDVCPVGALTSGSYRYKTRPWEMNHASTVCTHCSDGCKVTLGVRQANDGSAIIRADNRDKSGINGDFLCAKGRFGFDFVESPDRLTQPLVRNAQGKLEPATWEHAIRVAAAKLKEVRDTRGGSAIGVIGSNRTTNEENYLLQKFARTVLGTNNIDHERTTDYASFARALSGQPGKTASLRDIAQACAVLLIGGNPTDEHPLLAWLLRTNVRLNRARLYVANAKTIKLARQAKATRELRPGDLSRLAASLEAGQTDFSKAILAEESLIVIFGEDFRGEAVENLVAWGIKRGNVKFAYLGDHSNSRGAADMGLFPDLLPGYVPVSAPDAFAEYPNLPSAPGSSLPQMLSAADAGDLGALLVVGANPVSHAKLDPTVFQHTFVVVQDLFSLRLRRWLTWFFPPPAFTKNPARSQIPSATSRSSARPPTAPKSNLTWRFSFVSPEAWASTSARSSTSGSVAPPATWVNRAARNQAKPIVTPSGLRPMDWSRNSAHSILLQFSTKSSVSFPDTPSIASIFSRATTCTPSWPHPRSCPDSFPFPRSLRPNSLFPRTTLFSPQERWAVTARRSVNLNDIRHRRRSRLPLTENAHNGR